MPFELNIRQQNAVLGLGLGLSAANLLGEVDLLSRWLAKLSNLSTSFTDFEAIDFDRQWYSAMIASKQGKVAESQSIQERLLAHPYLESNPSQRLKVLSPLVENEILGGDATKSLEAYLRWLKRSCCPTPDSHGRSSSDTGICRACAIRAPHSFW